MSRNRRDRLGNRAARAVALAVAAGLVGCASPLEGEATESLRRSIAESAQREVSAAAQQPAPRALERRPSDLSFPPERMEELEKMAGPRSYGGMVSGDALGPDLTSNPTATIAINLESAIARAVRHNLALESARITPAITEAQVVAAEAAFDWAIFGGARASLVEEPQALRVIGGVPLGSSSDRTDVFGYDTGVRKRLTSGGTLSISQDLEITNNKSPGVSLDPDPSHLAGLDIALGQPLLRGFGSEANLAEVRLARNFERDAIQVLKAQLIDTVTRTERAYWDLVFANANLLIRQRLLDRGIQTRDVLKGRLDFDVKPAEYSDAVARVETRRADVIRASNRLRLRSDELKALMNDPDLTVGDETVLSPLDLPLDAPISFSLFDSLSTAFSRRPDVQRAILAIDDASIRQGFADNQRLPILDLMFRTRFSGLGDDAGGAYEEVGEASFVNYLVDLVFEYPIGNRAAESLSRQRRLERMQTVVNYRLAIQEATLAVKAALRNITTNYQLIEQTRTARIATAENLRTLQVEEENTRALTPDFLDLKLRRQDALALAELEEVQALVDYNTSIADLFEAMGTSLERNRIQFVVPNPDEPLGRMYDTEPDRPGADQPEADGASRRPTR